MPAPLPCPPMEILRAAANGSLSQSDWNLIWSHITSCPSCLAYVRTLETSEFVDAPFQSPIRSGDGSQDMGSPPTGWIGAYQVQSVLGAGGMGVVFRARDPQLNRLVAVKTVREEIVSQSGVLQRFLREARAVAALKHDNVVAIHHVGLHEGVPYLVMPLLEGETLAARLGRSRPLDSSLLIRIGTQIASALAAAHQKGITHRDVKPGNIWLESPSDRVKVLDFGLARTDADEYGEVPTFGTPGYMAPEQSRGDVVDHRVDLFSLGAVLYEMATGRGPFVGSSLNAVLTAIREMKPVAPRTVNPSISERLSDVVMKLLEKKPEDRFQSASETAKALQELSDDWHHVDTVVAGTVDHVRPPQPPAASREPTSGPPVRVGGVFTRWRVGAVATAASVGALFTVLAIRHFGGSSDRPSPAKTPEVDPAAFVGRPQEAPAESRPRLTFPFVPVALSSYSDHGGEVGAVSFCGDEDVLSVGTDNALRRWHAKRMTTTFSVSGTFVDAHRIIPSNDGRRALLLSLEPTFRIFNSKKGDLEKAFDAERGTFHCAAFVPNSALLVTGRADGIVELWSTDEGKVVGTLTSHPNGVSGIDVSPDARFAYTAGIDGIVRASSLDQRKELAVFVRLDEWAMDVVCIDDGRELVTSHGRTIRVLDAFKLTEKRRMEGHQAIIRRLTVAADRSILISKADDGCRVWNLRTGRHLANLPVANNLPPADVAISPDGKLAATADADGVVRIWDLSPLAELED